MAGAFTTHVRFRPPLEFSIDQRQQLIPRLDIPAPPGL
jgi:hypothetical protein